jgi:hypothetical protein
MRSRRWRQLWFDGAARNGIDTVAAAYQVPIYFDIDRGISGNVEIDRYFSIAWSGRDVEAAAA